MGCSGSKSDDLPLVVRCRERRDLIRAAANHRYALAAAHVSYFRSLRDIGDALRAFVDEELITASSSSSSFSSPSLILPPPNSKGKDKSHNHEYEVLGDLDDDDDDGSHIHLSDSSSDEDTTPHVHHKGFDNEGGSRYNGFGEGMVNNGGESRFNGYRQGFGEGMNIGYDGYGEGMVNNGFGERMVNNGFGGRFGERMVNNGFGGRFGERTVNNGFGGNRYNGFGGNRYNDPFTYPYPYSYPQQAPQYGGQQYMDPWNNYTGSNSNMYFMKKSAPATRTVVQHPPVGPGHGYSDSYWTSRPGYGGYYPNGNNGGAKVSLPKEPPPPPSPQASAWDFFNPFDGIGGGGGGYSGYYSGGGYGYGSNYSSPDSTEVRKREGIPDLEDETESEVYKEVVKGKRMKNGKMSSAESTPRSRAPPPMHRNSAGVSRSVPMHKSESSAKTLSSWSSAESEQPSMPPQHMTETGMPSMPPQYSRKGEKQSMPPHYNEETVNPSMGTGYGQEGEVPSMSPSHLNEEMSGSISLTEEKSSSEHIISTSTDEISVKKKGVTFDVEGTSKQDGESSMLSSLTLLSPNGNRDLREVVVEIKDEFETASSYGKEVAMMLEVGKLPYQPGFLKVLISRVLYLVSPSLAYRDPPSLQSAKLASKTMKLARSYFEDIGNDVNAKACNLSAVLDKLYAWEKKMYKEVKDEEKLRMSYEKQRKRLKMLNQEGAESTKIEAAVESVRRLVTKLDVSIRAIDTISSRIHKLRDEELQPQVASLVQGLIRMWKAMLKCHQKQFQAIMDTKMRKLKANIGSQTDSSSRATAKLECELRAWCDRFSDWIRFQKSYVKSLNGWLLQCLQYEPEVTPDGIIPYSPGRIGAPPIFVICNDWQEAMEAVPETRVENAMKSFATSLRQLWEKQDEEGRQRLKAEFLKKDYERTLKERGKLGKSDAASEKSAGMSVVASESGISPLDDLKVDLDSMRERLNEERVKHKDAMKLVHDAASSSLKGGLVPIFKALESFTSEALKAHEHVRLQQPEKSS